MICVWGRWRMSLRNPDILTSLLDTVVKVYLLIYRQSVTSISSLPPYWNVFYSILQLDHILNTAKGRLLWKKKKKKGSSWSRLLVGGFCGLCLNKQWNFPAFLFLLIYFLSVLFSQYCNASLDITQASLSCSASAESNLVRSAAARRIRLSFFRLLWNSPFFQHPKYTRQPNCWHVWEGQQDSCILSCPTMQNSTLFI